MLRRITLGLLMAIISTNAFAADREEIEVQIQERMAEAKEALDLSDEQVEQIKPILQKNVEAQADVLDNYGIELGNQSRDQNLGFRERRKLRGELKEVRKDTLDDLSEVLTNEQLEQYKAMSDERRAEARSKMRERRDSK